METLQQQLEEAQAALDTVTEAAIRTENEFLRMEQSGGRGFGLLGGLVHNFGGAVSDAGQKVADATQRVDAITEKLDAMAKAAADAAGGFRNLKDGMTDAQFEVFETQLKALNEQLEKAKRALEVEVQGEGWVKMAETFDTIADLPADRVNEMLALQQEALDAEQQLVDIREAKTAQAEREREAERKAAEDARAAEQAAKAAERERIQALEEQQRAQDKLRDSAMAYYYDSLTMEEKHANSMKVVQDAYDAQLITLEEYQRSVAEINKTLDDYKADELEKAAKAQEKLAKEAEKTAKQYDAFGNEVQTTYDLVKAGAEEAANQIQNTLGDAFYQLFTGTLDSAADWMEQFKKVVLQAIAQLAAALISNAIVVPIIAQLIPTGGTGVAGAAAGLLGGGSTGGGGILGGITGGNPLGGMTEWIGGGIATGLEMFGVPTGMATGIGSMAGTALGYGAAGYAIGSAIGGPNVGTGAAIGSALGSVVGSIIPGVGTMIGGAVGGLLGGAVGSLFGDSGGAKGPTGTGVAYLAVENGQVVSKGAEGISDPQGYINAINEMNAQIQSMAAQMPDGGSALAGINISAQEVTPETFDQFMQDTFGAITSQLGNNLGGLFADAWKQAGGNFDQFMDMLDQIEVVKNTIVDITQANVFEGFATALQSSVADQIEAVDERIRQLSDPETVAGLEELYNLTQSRYQMEIQYLAQLEAVMENLQAQADQAREQILLTGTSDQEAYQYFRDQANAAIAALESATNPEEIAYYSDRAMQYLMQSFQSLPEEMQAQYKSEFLSILDYIENVAGERAQAAADTSMAQYNATMALLAESQYQTTYLNGIQRSSEQAAAELAEIKNTLKTQQYGF